MKRCLMIFFAAILLSGCMGGSHPPEEMQRYTLEYSSPGSEAVSRTEQPIRVEKFTAIRSFRANHMIYRPGPYARGFYNYHRWDSAPADMLTDLLLRDIRRSDIFKSVLSSENVEDSRFVLEGRIEEFMEIDEGERSFASLIVYVTLRDSWKKPPAPPVILQKTYASREPLKERKPLELARAMSAATEKLSSLLILDLQTAVRESN